MIPKRVQVILFFIVTSLLVACATPAQPTTSEPTARPTTARPTTATEATPLDLELEPTASTESPLQPIDVTYITPAQQEGPYYPVEKLADQDNDLTTVAGASTAPAGDIVEFAGTLYDAHGYPIAGAVIEIWQTDANGIYLHPNDPQTANRDRNFQFYGEAVTAVDGRYFFRTILPGEYEPRPRHIHVKVKLDGQELLTTQFYFAGEVDLTGDAANLMIALSESQDNNGNTVWTGQRDIVLGIAVQ